MFSAKIKGDESEISLGAYTMLTIGDFYTILYALFCAVSICGCAFRLVKTINIKQGRFEMKRLVLITGIVGLILSGTFLIGCREKPSDSADGQPVRIAYLPTTSCLPLFVALEKGYFKEGGINVEAIRFTGTNDAINAVLAGRADGTPGFGLSTFFAIEAREPNSLKIYMPCVEDDENYANFLLVPKDSPITSIEELDGKKIGTYISSTQLLYLKLIMKKVLPEGHEWKILQVGSNLQIQALAAGQFDALFTLEPYATKAVKDGIARVLVANLRGKYIFSPFPAGANCFSASFVEQRQEVASKVAQAFAKAVIFIRNDPVAARAILPKYTPITADLTSEVGLYAWWLPGEEDFSALDKLSSLLSSQKLIDKTVKAQDMYWKFK